MKHKHALRSGISLLLVLCMVLSLCPLTAFAEGTEKPELNLVSFGDSMTNGYGHKGYSYGESTQVNGFRQDDVTTTYPYYLKKWLSSTYDVNWEALAVSCMRTEDVNFLLRYHKDDNTWNELAQKLDSDDGGYGSSTVANWKKENGAKAAWEATFVDDGNVIGDYFTWNEFVNGRFWDWQKTTEYADKDGYTWHSNPTLAYANYYQNAVKNADVITLGTGNANFGVIMLQNITGYLAGPQFGGGLWDAVPVREVLQRRLPADIYPQALEILDKVDALVVPKLAMIGTDKAAKVLEIVEHTTVSFMFSYMDMLYAIDELNDKDLDVIMMGLMNTMDGVKINLGGGQIFDLGAVVDGITDVLSAYYFVLPVALQELNGDFENITFYIVPNDDHIEMQVSEMADLGKIQASETLRERMIQGVSGMIFGLVRGPLNDALTLEEGQAVVQLPTWSMNDDTAGQYREKVEAYVQLQADYEAWVETEDKTAPFNIMAKTSDEEAAPYKYGALITIVESTPTFNANDALACAVYLAFERAIIKNADNATLDLNGLMSLMGGTAGLAGMMEPITDSLTTAFGGAAQAALTNKVATSVAAQLVADNKAQYNTEEEIKTAIQGQITVLSAAITSASGDTKTMLENLKNGLEDIKNQPIVPAGNWYNLSFTGDEAASNMASVGATLSAFANSMDVTKDDNVVAAPTAMFTAIELTNALNGALGGALTSEDAASLGGLLSLYARMIIGNGIGSHPTANGHLTLFNEIKEVYPNKPAKAFLEEVVKDTAEKLYQLAKSGNIEALDKIVAFALEQGLIDEAHAELIKAQLPQIYVAVYEQNDEAILNSCKKLAVLLYDYGRENGYINDEIHTIVTEAIRVYDEIKDMTPDELKAYVKEQLEALADKYGPEALEKLNEYVLSLDVLDERQLGELEAKIWDYIQKYPDAPKATLDAAANELVDFLFEITELDKDKVMAMYEYLTTTSGEQMLADAAELMQKYLDKYGPEALEYVENYLIEEGYVTAEEIAEITKQVKLAIAAYEAQDKAAMKASCEKLAELVYAYADANGYIPAEVKEAYAKAIELYEKYGEMTPEEIKAFAAAELKKFIAEHKAEALIAIQTYIVNEGWMGTTELKGLAEKIAAAIAAYKADPEGTTDAMIEELVNYIYNKAVAEGYIDPAKVEELNKLVDLIKEACDYFANTPEEQIKADAIALLFDELDKLTDGKVNAEVYAQIKADVAELIAALEDVTPGTIQAKVDDYINSIKAKYLALIDDATHGKYVPNGESYYVALGGDTVYGTGIGKYDDGYFDLLLEELGLDGKTQYKNLGKQNLDLTELLAYIEENADEIEKADLITYQADAAAFILAALNEETPDWSRYLTAEQIAFVEEALPVIQTILEDDWTKYADLDAEQIVNDIETEVLGAIDDAIMDAFNGQADKLDELLSICVAQVKSYVEYIQEQAFKLYFEAVIGETVLYYSLMKPVYEVLGEDWASYADLDVKQIVSEIKGEVLAKAGEAKNFSAEKINEVLAHCVEKALELHEYADAEIAKLPEYFSNEELAFAQAAFELVWEYAVKQWPELAELDVEELHEQAYAEIMKLLTEADNFNYEQYVDLGAKKIEEILNCCVDEAMEAIKSVQDDVENVVVMLDKAEGSFIIKALEFMFDYMVEDWSVYVDESAAWVSNQIKDAVIAEMKKQSAIGEEYVNAYAADLVAILTPCIEEAQNVLQTAQNQKDEVLNVLNTIEPFKPYIEKLLFASVAYAVDTAKAVDAIQEINPDATLIVVGMYNPLDGLEIVMNGKTIDVGAYMDYLIDATNVYYTALAVADGEFTFVAVPGTTINGFEDAINVDELNISKLGSMLLKLNDSMYANANGHKYIFEQIMGALDTTNNVISISVTTAPTKTSYVAGQNFDSTGMVITATYYDGSTKTVEGWSVTDGNDLTTGRTSVTISYTEGDDTVTCTQNITVVAKALTGISVKTAPTKTSYTAGQVFDSTGMVITATYNDGTTVDKNSGWTVTDGNNLPAGKTSVTISYTEGGVTKTTTQAITVTATGSGTGDGGGGGVTPKPVVPEFKKQFVDVDANDYFYDAVLWAAENGITLGVDETHFAPMAITTRGQMVTFLWRAAGCPEPTATTCAFTDVEANGYYYKAVLWAIETGLTKGTSDTTFSPDAEVSRGQTVTFLARLNGVKDDATGYSHDFADVKTTDYFNNAVAWAATNEITNGTSATTFSPNNDCLRGQIVTFLYRNFVK